MAEELNTLEAGEFTLVARFNKGAYRGALWHSGRIINEVQGSSLDEAYQSLLRLLYEHQVAKAASREGQAPSSSETEKAFERIWAKMTHGQRKMLIAHYKAPQHRITATELAQAAGYANYSAANLHYGLLGALVFSEMPEVLPSRADGTPIMTFAIATGNASDLSAENHWVWTMRPHIVEALDKLKHF
jgi:hypothetical protein